MQKHQLRALPALLAGLVLGGACGTAGASGFQLLEQNVSGLGNAYAGSAAVAQDASTIFFNPAGMALLDGRQFSVGLNVITPSMKFNNNGSVNPTAMGGAAATGPTGDAGYTAFLPDAYLSVPLTERVTVGLGVGAPFGLKTEYDPGWAGQYQSDKFDIKTINVNPSIAYKATDKLSLGFGLNYQKIEAEYVKMAVVAPLTDRLVTIKLDDNAWGWNAGFMYQLSDAMRVGLSYRSDISYHATGNITIGTAPGTANADVKLPATWVWSVYQVLSDRWEMMGDISYTQWSSIPQLLIHSSIAPDDALNLQFKNTWRVALGGTYKYSDTWKLRFGVAYDQSPVPSDTLRPTSLPDNDRWWLSLGAQYRISPAASVDMGYTHLFVHDPTISNNGGSQITKGLVQGTYSNSVDILGVQYNQKF